MESWRLDENGSIETPAETKQVHASDLLPPATVELLRAAQHTGSPVHSLLARGASPQCRDPHQNTVLHFAAYNGAVDQVNALLAAAADPNAAHPVLRYTPLHLAALGISQPGAAAVVTALIEARASPKSRDNSGSTPLHLGAKHGNLHAVVALVEVAERLHGPMYRKKFVRLLDGASKTALALATEQCRSGVVKCDAVQRFLAEGRSVSDRIRSWP